MYFQLYIFKIVERDSRIVRGLKSFTKNGSYKIKDDNVK